MVLYRLLATPIVYVAIVKIDQKQKLHVFLVFGINCWWRSMKLKLLCWKLFLWCILNAYKIDVVVYFFNMVWHFSLICSIVCVCKMSDKNGRDFWNYSSWYRGPFFLDTVRVYHSATIFKHVDIFVLAGCRRSIIFVLIQVIHFIFYSKIHNVDDDLMITVISFVFDKARWLMILLLICY